MEDGLVHAAPHATEIEDRSPWEEIGTSKHGARICDVDELVAVHVYQLAYLEQAQ